MVNIYNHASRKTCLRIWTKSARRSASFHPHWKCAHWRLANAGLVHNQTLPKQHVRREERRKKTNSPMAYNLIILKVPLRTVIKQHDSLSPRNSKLVTSLIVLICGQNTELVYSQTYRLRPFVWYEKKKKTSTGLLEREARPGSQVVHHVDLVIGGTGPVVRDVCGVCICDCGRQANRGLDPWTCSH